MEKNKEKDYQTLPFRLILHSDHVMTTCYTKDVAGQIILNEGKGEILTRQKVVFCGPASGLYPGDIVEMNTDRFKKVPIKNKYDVGPDELRIIPPVELVEGYAFLFVSMMEIKFVYEKIDKIPDPVENDRWIEKELDKL